MARKPPQARDWLDLGGGNRKLVEAGWETLVEGSSDAVLKSRRVILGALSSGTPLPLWVLRLIADDLERYWFNRKTPRSQIKADKLQLDIYRVKKEGKLSSRAKAKEKIADFERVSVPALDQRLRRARRAREKR